MTWRARVAWSLVAVTAAACGDDMPPPLTGSIHQYVVSELRIATDNTTARAYAVDLDGDTRPDNRLGQVFGALNNLGLGVDGTAREALVRGGVIMLAELQTTDFHATARSGFMTYLGGDPTPVPCLDPARLETCGQHLMGTGQFSVDLATASDHGVAAIEEGVFRAVMGRVPIQIAIDPDAPLRVDLRGARIWLSELEEDRLVGVLGGGIVEADVDGVVVPEAAAQMDRIVVAECGQPEGLAPCGCPGGERSEVLQRYFDTDDDCRISVAETAANSITQSLLEPDVQIDGVDALSFGVGVELVPAMF